MFFMITSIPCDKDIFDPIDFWCHTQLIEIKQYSFFPSEIWASGQRNKKEYPLEEVFVLSCQSSKDHTSAFFIKEYAIVPRKYSESL